MISRILQCLLIASLVSLMPGVLAAAPLSSADPDSAKKAEATDKGGSSQGKAPLAGKTSGNKTYTISVGGAGKNASGKESSAGSTASQAGAGGTRRSGNLAFPSSAPSRQFAQSPSAGKSAGKKESAPSRLARPSRGNLANFSGNAFSADYLNSGAKKKGGEAARMSRYAVRPTNYDKDRLMLDSPLRVDNSDTDSGEDNIKPRRAALPGDKHTMSQLEEYSPMEMEMQYQVTKKASARLSVNSQDQQSPIYAPIKKEDGVRATGVYMDMDMTKDVQVQVGGEYRSLESERSENSGQSSKGASMGFRWNF